MLFATDKSAAVDDADKLLPEVLIQRDLMIEVATGETRIQDVDDYYRARHRRISAALKARGIENPNPHENLWSWYHKWKEAGWGTYQERRAYVREMYARLIERLV